MSSSGSSSWGSPSSSAVKDVDYSTVDPCFYVSLWVSSLKTSSLVHYITVMGTWNSLTGSLKWQSTWHSLTGTLHQHDGHEYLIVPDLYTKPQSWEPDRIWWIHQTTVESTCHYLTFTQHQCHKYLTVPDCTWLVHFTTNSNIWHKLTDTLHQNHK